MIWPPVMTASGAALAVAGLACLSSTPRLAFRVALTIGSAVLAWSIVWRLLILASKPWVLALDTENIDWKTIAAINLSLGFLAWLRPARAVLFFPATAVPAGYRGAFSLIWLAGFILPFIGQGGTWPPTSMVLAALVILLGLALSLAFSARNRTKGRTV